MLKKMLSMAMLAVFLICVSGCEKNEIREQKNVEVEHRSTETVVE